MRSIESPNSSELATTCDTGTSIFMTRECCMRAFAPCMPGGGDGGVRESGRTAVARLRFTMSSARSAVATASSSPRSSTSGSMLLSMCSTCGAARH